jgi:hypothetical protein
MSGSHTSRGGEEARAEREHADEAAIEAQTRKAEAVEVEEQAKPERRVSAGAA